MLAGGPAEPLQLDGRLRGSLLPHTHWPHPPSSPPQITQLPSAEWGQGSAQAALAAAERGLPPPDALEQLRRMALPEAVSLYNSTVARVRQLLQQADHGPGQAEAQAALADLFAFSGGSGVRWDRRRDGGSSRLRAAHARRCCGAGDPTTNPTLAPPAHPGCAPCSFASQVQGTFGYLQVVSPQVYAELMQAKLDPCSPGG